MRLLVADEVADVGVHLGEDEGDVVAEADLPAPDGLDGRRAALVIVCEEKGNIIKGKGPSSRPTKAKVSRYAQQQVLQCDNSCGVASMACQPP